MTPRDRSARLDQPLQGAKARLERLSISRPELRRLTELSAQLLALLFDSSASEECEIELGSSPRPWDSSNREPLLRVLPARIDGQSFTRRFLNVCQVAEKFSLAPSAIALADAVRCNRLDPAAELVSILARGTDAFCDMLQRLELNAELGLTLLRFCAVPDMSTISHRFADLVRESSWGEGFCPICGSWAILAELRGLDRSRWLRCGLCAAEWSLDRLLCPRCGERDHQQLSNLCVEGDEQGATLSRCQSCGGWLIELPVLHRLSAPELIVAEVETLHLRFIAKQA